MPRVADIIMQKLVDIGIRDVFLVTGRGMLYLSDALAKNENLRAICTHHEQSAAFAAMAAAQTSGKLGVCMVSTGCAATNALTPTLCAWQDNVPMLVISGQHKLNETTHYTKLPIRTYGQQEADIIALAKPITKYAVMLTKPESVEFELEKAIYLAQNARKGPVWIDVPLDIQNARVERDNLEHFTPNKSEFHANKADINFVLQKLQKAKRAVILYGSGVKDAKNELEKFMLKTKIPAVYASSAVDILSSQNALNIGCVGAMGANRAANFAVQNADFVLVLGCRMNSMLTGDIANFVREGEIITVDIDENEHKKFGKKISKIIVADAKCFLEDLLVQNLPQTPEFWQEKCKFYKQKFPKCEERFKGDGLVDLYYLAEILENVLEKDGVLVSDAGLEELIIPTSVNFRENQRCIHPAAQGAMGYALPAAIGAYLASKKQVIAVIGDGSVMMNLQELQTIKHHKFPIKILIINNDCYAVIRKRQQEIFRRAIGTDEANGISCPDFQKIAECFEFKYAKISSSKELVNLKQILKTNEPLICEIMAKPDQIYIHSSFKRENGKFTQPPIEDQSPFLDREIFNEAMIIKPI